MPLRRLLYRMQLICAGTLEHIKEMQEFRFEVQVRTGRPAARVPAETNNLAAAIGASRSTNAQIAVAGLDASPSENSHQPLPEAMDLIKSASLTFR